MKTVLTGGKIFKDNDFTENDTFVLSSDCDMQRVIPIDNSFILPSFCDVHVHFREPGFEYKETIKTGSMAAARGGYTTVGTMPNLKPVPGSVDRLKVQLDIIDRDSLINALPYGTITSNQSGHGVLSDMEGMADSVIAFTDDGVGIQDRGLMREAMEVAKSLNKIIVAHCEDMELLRQGKVRESEWKQIERDLVLADEVNAAYHVCHISTEESVAVIREAKKSGVNVTCETAPHYLTLDDSIIKSAINQNNAIGGRFKMNPPIKKKSDRLALINGIQDGTIDMIATDHAPHSQEEKARGFNGSLNGITGLECSFPVLYTKLVKEGVISFERLMELMATAPRKRFSIKEDSSYTIVDMENKFRIDSNSFVSKGKCTPFNGMDVFGKVLMTIYNGRVVFDARDGNDKFYGIDAEEVK